MTRLDVDQAYDLCHLLRRHHSLYGPEAVLVTKLVQGFDEIVLRGDERQLVLTGELTLSGAGLEGGRLDLLQQELGRLARSWGLRYAPVVLHPTVRQRLSSLAL